MKVVFVIEEREIELLDRDIAFEEGEKVFLVEKGTRLPLTVAAVKKALAVEGNNAECTYLVYLQ